jgi:hypothetical protein
MTTDLALLAQDPSALEQAADPAQFVVLACERAKTWLTQALEQGDIAQMLELKSQAQAIAVYTAQKEMGHDAELAAQEIVRRAERGIGMAIRKGQEEGTIRRRGETSRRYDRWSGEVNVTDNSIKASPEDFVKRSELDGSNRNGIYGLADGVTDEQFDEAVTAAKTEGNLSRANVVRKVKGAPPPRNSARHELLRNTHHHDPNRIVNETVMALEGLRLGLDLIDWERVDPEQIPAWADSLSESIRSLNRLRAELRSRKESDPA